MEIRRLYQFKGLSFNISEAQIFLRFKVDFLDSAIGVPKAAGSATRIFLTMRKNPLVKHQYLNTPKSVLVHGRKCGRMMLLN